MPTLNQIFKAAKRRKSAIGHFNAATFEQMKAIVKAAKITKLPVMVGTSEGEEHYLGIRQSVALFREFRQETKVPIFLNLDHAHSFETCQLAIDAGYDSILIDASRIPYEKNLLLTKKVRDYAKKKDRHISVEGELGVLPTESSKVYHTKIKIDTNLFTNPDEARQFVRFTGVDRLAPAFGTLHGIQAGGINPHIDLKRLREINQAVPNVFLVMHGGSGTPRADFRRAINAGIVNIHVSTELRQLYVKSMRDEFRKEEYAPYKILEPVVEKMTKFIIKEMLLFK